MSQLFAWGGQSTGVSTLGKCKSKPQWDTISHPLAWLKQKRQVLVRMWRIWTPIHCWLDSKMVRPLWETIWQFLKIDGEIQRVIKNSGWHHGRERLRVSKWWCYWLFGRTDAKAETPILWPPHANSWLTGKDPDAGGIRDRRRRVQQRMRWLDGITDRLDGHESEWTPGVGDGQGGLAFCDSWGRKESDTTEWLNWSELTIINSEFYFR